MNRHSWVILCLWIMHVGALCWILFLFSINLAAFLTAVYVSFSLGVYTQALGGKAKTWKEFWLGYEQANQKI